MPFNEGVHDQPSATPTEFYRTGSTFDSRPRKSVEDGDDVAFLTDNHGRQYVNAEIVSPLAAFGEVSISELHPLIQLQFPYSVNPRLLRELKTGSGGATVANSLLNVHTETTTASYNLVESRERAKYHPGQGTLARWTSVFDASGTNGTEAIMGIGNEEDGFFFGRQDASGVNTFGILHRFAGKIEYRTLTFTTGAVTAGGTVTVTLDDVATETEVTNGGSVQNVAREVGATSYVGWETQIIGDVVIFISHLAEAKSGTFTFADTDTTGVLATAGLVQSITGVAPTDDFIPQADWNSDKMNGTNDDGTNPTKMTLDISKGNVYEVQFQWLGFGEIIFSIENENTGHFHPVHRIKYTNTNTVPSMQNPTLPLYIAVKNGATTTDINIQTSSMAVFTEGIVDETNQGLPNSTAATLSGDLTTETAIFAVKSKPIFQNVENRVEWAPKIFTVSGKGAGAAKFTTIRATVDPVLGGNPVFTDISTATSIMAIDTAGTTLTGGSVVATFEFGADFTPGPIDLTTFTVNQPPGTLIVFSAEIDGGTSDIDAGLIWRELF